MKLRVFRGLGNELIVWNEKKIALRLKDPAGQLGIEQAVFLPGSGEALVELGDFLYVLDVRSKRMGPVMRGRQFIVMGELFSKHRDD